MPEKQYCVYIMTNAHHTVLYTGVTNNLQRRVLEHQSGKGSKFTSKYNVNKLVYFECSNDVNAAILREKQIKAGSRKKKLDLINNMNPKWNDLFTTYFGRNEEIASGENHCPRNDT
ncbi:MAG: GIY-YIG nuclease family protein [Anaerolineales bacterium]|nr:GIY-YIG nuclease family protein [Anaerolineales bacterium]